MEFKLTSPAFGNGSLIPSNYTCDGAQSTPHLIIHGVPERARSLALIMENPDAPPGQECHWVLWNIPPQTKELREHVVPFNAQVGVNSFRKSGYSGPCPTGSERYIFRLYALDRKLELSAAAGRSELEGAMEFHILASTELVGTYTRTNEAPM